MAKISFSPIGFIRSTIEENQKVTWPTREIIIRHTLMVIISVVVAMLIFTSIDFGLQQLVLLALASTK